MSWWKDYLSFSRRERTAFAVFLVLMAGFIFLPDLVAPRRKPVITNEIAQVIQRPVKAGGSYAPAGGQENLTVNGFDQPKPVLFVFDPNTLDSVGFVRLGLPGRTARTIVNYRNKGGWFRSPDDLRKIYSLRSEDADRIIPYARVKPRPYPSAENRYRERQPYRSRYTIPQIDINKATAEEWIALPGIGNVLSARIVRFRESIGGFSSIDQVSKTFGLPDSTFRKILPYLELAQPATMRININTARESELMECEGMTPELAKAIIIRRKQHGPYQSVEDLRKIVFMSEALFNQVSSCLDVR